MKDLREKIENILVFNYQSYITTEQAVTGCVQIAETHAKDEAIGFNKFLREFYLNNSVKLSLGKTTEELYEIYQQQKQKL